MDNLTKNTMHDLGEEQKYGITTCGCDDCKEKKDEEKSKKHYPRETFSDEQLPDLSDARLGDTVTLVIKAKVVAVKAGQEYEFSEDEGDTKTRVTLKLLKGKVKEIVGESDDDEIEEMSTKKKGAMDRLMDDED